MDIITTLNDPMLLGSFIDPATWQTWLTIFKAAFALPPAKGDLELFTAVTGRSKWPSESCKELWIIAGRRSGKSVNASILAGYFAAFIKYALRIGERATIPIISPTRVQSRIIAGYIFSIFEESPMLSTLVERQTSTDLNLKNGIDVAILSSDFRSIRGFTCPVVILDEVAFFNSEGSRPDDEILRAVRPTLITLNGILIGISSPYAKRGVLWETYQRHWGKNDSDVLVIQAESTLLNPTLNKETIDHATEEDPSAAESEWFGKFRSDIESYVSREAVSACVVEGRYELPPDKSIHYSAFVDPAGGSGQDSFTMAICHQEKDFKVLDLVREVKPPFSPEQTISDFAKVLKAYGISTVTGDRFGGEFPRELFRGHDIAYKLSAKNKSEIYKELLPMINSGQVLLLDHQKMIDQLCNLERRTARGGRDSIDHPPRAHDDIINSVAGVLISKDRKRLAGPIFN